MTYNIKIIENRIHFNFDEFVFFFFALHVFYHRIYCWHNVLHFFSWNRATLVFVIQFKCPWMQNLHIIHVTCMVIDGMRMKNLHSSLSSREPRQVIEIATRNSWKLTIPSLSVFKKLKRYSANFVGSPCGKSLIFYLRVENQWLHK